MVTSRLKLNKYDRKRNSMPDLRAELELPNLKHTEKIQPFKLDDNKVSKLNKYEDQEYESEGKRK